jgi:uncharacterized ion transporter superfamily protein YfcC
MFKTAARLLAVAMGVRSGWINVLATTVSAAIAEPALHAGNTFGKR